MSRQTDEDLLAELGKLGSEAPTPAKTAKPKASSKKTAAAPKKSEETGEDALADIEKQLAAAPQRGSRPSTPRLSSSTTSGTTKKGEHTPASTGPPSERSSDERLRAAGNQPRKSGESARSFHQAQTLTPGTTTEEGSPKQEDTAPQPAAQQSGGGGGGGGWGGWFSTTFSAATSAATAAAKQAEVLAKELRQNEEAQKWAEQVRGRVGNLQSFGTDLRSRALPTFTSLLQHIAPPISAHERLQIHTTHDIQNYPSLDPLIYETFARVMAQVEGGDLMVIQRGSESRNRRGSEPQGFRGGLVSSGGWKDGPWWREEGPSRSLGTVPGLKEGTRLTRVSAESHAKEFFDSRGGVEEAAKRATETLSESNPVRSSDIFLAIQAISYEACKEYFAGDVREDDKEKSAVAEPEEESDEVICFAIYLHDPIHSLSFSTTSQPFPKRWADWLDASAESGGLPESIKEIIASGGVDPREWVAEWMEELLGLAVGVVAQRYVARRMGVGEGGIGRGKRRAEEEDISGEAARAGI